MKTLLVAILDRSGSMHSQIDDAIGGINAFIEQQRNEPGECDYEEVLFDNEIIRKEAVDIKGVEPHTKLTYVPRGNTALLDAIGSSIVGVGERLSNQADKPDKVIFAILTDGFENASKEYNKTRVTELIKHQEDKYSWTFIYLAADKLGESYGRDLGIMASQSYGGNMTRGFADLNSMVSASRV